MSRSAGPGVWDGPFYRVETDHFVATFLPNSVDAVEPADNIDVFVDLPDGSRWSATILALAEVGRVMARWEASGESLGGRYFHVSDGLVVRDAGVDAMTQVLVGLFENGEFAEALQRIED